MKKNSPDKKELKLPVGRQVFPEPRALSMDDYYEFVVSNIELFGKPPLEPIHSSKRFVIREEDEKYFSKKKS
jgi:hypothetical protein